MNISQVLSNILNHPIGRKSPITTLFRFFYWQMFYRIIRPYKWVKLIGEIKIKLLPSLAGVTGTYYTGLLEFEDMGFLLHFLSPEDHFMDIGANAGVYTLLASGHCRAQSIAVEPVSVTADILEENISKNDLGQLVGVVRKIVSNEEGSLKISNDKDAMNAVVRDDSAKNVEVVDTISLDDLGTTIPKLVKIDVEGEELQVIESGMNMLGHPDLKAVIMETNGEDEESRNKRNLLVSKMRGCGFQMYTYDPFSKTLKPSKEIGMHNTLFIKDEDFVQKRLLMANEFRIHNLNI